MDTQCKFSESALPSFAYIYQYSQLSHSGRRASRWGGRVCLAPARPNLTCFCLWFVFCSKLQNWWRRRQNIETPDLTEYTRWELDYDLTQYPAHGLFYEYLEMGKSYFMGGGEERGEEGGTQLFCFAGYRDVRAYKQRPCISRNRPALYAKPLFL